MGTLPVAPPVRPAHHSNPLLIPMVFIGGIMGVLAAYGVLALIRDHGANLKPPAQVVTAAPATPQPVAAASPKSNSPQRLTSPKTNSTPLVSPTPGPQSRDVAVSKPQINSLTNPAPIAAEQDDASPPRPRPVTHASVASLKIATDDASPQASANLAASAGPPLPPPEAPSSDTSTDSSENASHKRAKAAAAAANAVIVPLTLKQGTVRVIALLNNLPADSVLCDIGFSSDLSDRGVPAGTYDMVVQGLEKRGQYRQELPLHIDGAGAAIDIAIRQQNNAVICEISPKFSLPLTGVKQLTIANGSILQTTLNKTLSNTLNAEQELPGMRSNLASLKLQLADAIAHTNDTGSDINDTGSLRIRWRARVQQLQNAIRKTSNNIAHDENLVANKSAIQIDIADLNQISQFVQRIAPNASLSVRFYNGDETIAATLK